MLSRSRDPIPHFVKSDPPEASLVGSSPAMRAVCEWLRHAAATDFDVRIEGPTGSGKGLAARLLHQWSRRAAGPFLRYSMGSVPAGLEQAHLRGWVKGAFTGAVGDVPGAMEAAHHGTLFLDEMACASLPVQEALLTLLEDPEVFRLGESRSRKLDVRFVFATNADLKAEVLAGRFRNDLLARMRLLVLRMPALVDRLDDLPQLVEYLLPLVAARGRCPVRALGPRELDTLAAHTWPENVRELESVLAHWLTFGELPSLTGADQAELLWYTLERCGWNKSRVGRELGVARKTVNAWIRRFALRPGFPTGCNQVPPGL